MSKFKENEIVTHKFSPKLKFRITKEINQTQYEIENINTKEKMVCMTIYLMNTEENRDHIIETLLKNEK